MKKTRAQMVEAACELFREKGYDGASMQDLADRLGLTKAAIYGRFRCKEELVAAVLSLTLDHIRSADRPAKRPGERYVRAIRHIAGTLLGQRRSVELQLACGIAETEPDARRAVQHFFLSLRDHLSAALADAVPEEEAVEIATDAVSRLEGATIWLVTADDTGPLQRATRAMEAEIAARIGAPPVVAKRSSPQIGADTA